MVAKLIKILLAHRARDSIGHHIEAQAVSNRCAEVARAQDSGIAVLLRRHSSDKGPGMGLSNAKEPLNLSLAGGGSLGT